MSTARRMTSKAPVPTNAGASSRRTEMTVASAKKGRAITSTSAKKGGQKEVETESSEKLTARLSRRLPSTPSKSVQDTSGPCNSGYAWVPVNHTATPRLEPHDLWKTGPADPSGTVLNLSDRPLLCMSVRGSEVAIGCADHGVYVIDVFSKKLQRNLYSKSYGHADWVTCVDYLRDGRILSGGMDNVLCLWDATGIHCSNLIGHSASISATKVIDSGYAISASYDKTLMLWDLNRERPTGCLQGHRGAVLDFAVTSGGGIVSGSREGEVFLWDGSEGKSVLRYKAGHIGHVTAVECFTENATEIFITGGQDGVLQVWDKRIKSPVSTVTLSRSSQGKGAVSNIAITAVSVGGPPLVIAASADKMIRILEPRSSFGIACVLKGHTHFIYSLYACGALVWSGGGNGRLLVHDLRDGSCLYGLGATRNGATRCVSLVGIRALAVVGDDGSCMLYYV